MVKVKRIKESNGCYQTAVLSHLLCPICCISKNPCELCRWVELGTVVESNSVQRTLTALDCNAITVRVKHPGGEYFAPVGSTQVNVTEKVMWVSSETISDSVQISCTPMLSYDQIKNEKHLLHSWNYGIIKGLESESAKDRNIIQITLIFWNALEDGDFKADKFQIMALDLVRIKE